MNANERTLGSQ